jgi:hypothetical protein
MTAHTSALRRLLAPAGGRPRPRSRRAPPPTHRLANLLPDFAGRAQARYDGASTPEALAAYGRTGAWSAWPCGSQARQAARRAGRPRRQSTGTRRTLELRAASSNYRATARATPGRLARMGLPPWPPRTRSPDDSPPSGAVTMARLADHRREQGEPLPRRCTACHRTESSRRTVTGTKAKAGAQSRTTPAGRARDPSRASHVP